MCLNLLFSIETVTNDSPTLMVNFKLKMEVLRSANFDTYFRNNEFIKNKINDTLQIRLGLDQNPPYIQSHGGDIKMIVRCTIKRWKGRILVH